MPALLKASVAILAVLYPFAVYIGLNYFSVRVIAGLLFALLLLRLILMRSVLMKHSAALIFPSVVGVFMAAIVVFTGGEAQLTLMPVAINIGFFCAFIYSWLRPPTVIEIMARMQEPDLPEAGVRYTEKVTLAWCVFFVCLGSVSFYTHQLNDLKVWTLFNGFIAYLLIGLFAACEWVVRQFAKKAHQQSEAAQVNLSSSEAER